MILSNRLRGENGRRTTVIAATVGVQQSPESLQHSLQVRILPEPFTLTTTKRNTNMTRFRKFLVKLLITFIFFSFPLWPLFGQWLSVHGPDWLVLDHPGINWPCFGFVVLGLFLHMCLIVGLSMEEHRQRWDN